MAANNNATAFDRATARMRPAAREEFRKWMIDCGYDERHPVVHGALGVWLNLSTAQEIEKRVKASLETLERNQDIATRLRWTLIGLALCVLLGFGAASMAYERGFAAGWQSAASQSQGGPRK